MPKSLIWILVCAIAPFFVKLGGSSSTSVNGVVVECSSFNLAGIAGGAVALFLIAGLLRQTEPEVEGHHKALAVGAGLIAVIQLFLGFGMIGGACS